VFLDYLHLVYRSHDRPLPEEFTKKQNLYKPSAFLNELRAKDPEVVLRMRFSRLVSTRLGLIRSGKPIDPQWVADAHQSLDEYLHAQKDHIATVGSAEWREELSQRLKAIAQELYDMLEPGLSYMNPEKMLPSGRAVYESMKKQNLSDDAVLRMLDLSDLTGGKYRQVY
jgi:hypothetical protein